MNTKEIIKNNNNIEVYKSKFGFHPCDKETYIKLKRLNYLFLQAEKMASRWNRWARKDEHNRVIRKRKKDEFGRKNGYEVIGPMPEPKIKSIFCSFDPQKDGWTQGNKVSPYYYGLRKDNQSVWTRECNSRYLFDTGLYVDNFGIKGAYIMAKGFTNMNDVAPLKISLERIDELYNAALKI